VNDLLGITEHPPKLAKAYANLRDEMTRAVNRFIADVESGSFPDEGHSYS
jgi:3-methyl-2-oxobutanoate hydroxymethyltransferase